MVVNLSDPAAVTQILAKANVVRQPVTQDLSVSALGAVSHMTVAHLFLRSQGALRVAYRLSLPGNAVPQRCMIKVTARRADIVYAATVAQLRGEDGTDLNDKVIIVDFGTLRTVARVGFDVTCMIRKVEMWNGTEFPRSSYPPFVTFDVPANPPSGRAAVSLDSDVRTQKLRITVAASDSAETLMENLTLMLPDAPQDLSLSIDGGVPVWSLPGPAAEGADTDLTVDDWNTNGERLVDLTEALRKHVGDPLASEDRVFDLTLNSAEAGVLALAPYEMTYQRIRRAQIAGSATVDRQFETEGVETLTLDLPDAPPTASVHGLSLRAAGQFGPDRRLPPVGPDAAMASTTGQVLAELTISPDRAVIFHANANALPALSGVRLNLTAGSAGAEVRVIPWSPTAGADLPQTALEDLTGAPVTLAAGATGWVSLPFAGPVPATPAPWVAIVVARGAVTTGLSRSGATLRIGPSGGPWRAVPHGFTAAPLSDLGLSYRTMGDATDDGTPAPVQIAFGPTRLDVTPDDTGQTLTVTPATPGMGRSLTLTRRGPGTLRLTNIDVITDK